MNSTQNLCYDYSNCKENWKQKSICHKLTNIAYYYSLHFFRLNYYYYADYNKYSSYKSFVWFVQQQDRN